MDVIIDRQLVAEARNLIGMIKDIENRYLEQRILEKLDKILDDNPLPATWVVANVGINLLPTTLIAQNTTAAICVRQTFDTYQEAEKYVRDRPCSNLIVTKVKND